MWLQLYLVIDFIKHTLQVKRIYQSNASFISSKGCSRSKKLSHTKEGGGGDKAAAYGTRYLRGPMSSHILVSKGRRAKVRKSEETSIWLPNRAPDSPALNSGST